MAAGWSEGQTCTLIDVWGAADVQHQLDSVSYKKQAHNLYQRISQALPDMVIIKHGNNVRLK